MLIKRRMIMFERLVVAEVTRSGPVVSSHYQTRMTTTNTARCLNVFRGRLRLAATNHQNILDPAIWRRFDDVIYFDLPKEESRKKLIVNYLKSIKREGNIDLSLLSAKMDGFSPADIKMATESAMKHAIINSRNSISMNDLDKAIMAFIQREKVKNNELGDNK